MRGMTWGNTPNTTRDAQDAPAAVSASRGAGSISSTASASSFPRKPTLPTTRVTTPANGPNPNIATNRMATRISWNARDTANTAREAVYTGPGTRLRAAPSPRGTERTSAAAVATAVIARLSRRPARMSVHRVTKSGRSHPPKNVPARDSPSTILAGSMSTVTKTTSPYSASPPRRSLRVAALSILRRGRQR